MLSLTEAQKKIIFIVFFVTFTIGTGYALYYFFFKPLPSPDADMSGITATYPGAFSEAGDRLTTGSAVPPGASPLPIATTIPGSTIASAESDLLRSQVTQSLSLNKQGLTRFYNPLDGRFYTLDSDGEDVRLSNRQFLNVSDISWSSISNQAILEFPDGSNIYYNFDEDRQVNLPTHWEDFAFSPVEDKITAKSMGLDERNRFLVVADANGNEATAMYELGANADRVIPSWSPNNSVIGFSKTGDPQPDGGEEILLLGRNHEIFKPLKVAGKGFLPSWSPTGKQLLYSIYHERDNYKPMLWISEASGPNIGQNRRRLNINTWADKCVWSDEQTLYCAVPVSLPDGAGWDREKFNATSDDMYKIDLKTGVAQKINKSPLARPINNPQLTPDKNQIIYTDTITGRLYKFDL
jgi:Tol biopolymer transport system component